MTTNSTHDRDLETKGEVGMDEIKDQREVHAYAVKPASLANMTDEDIIALDKKMVRKMDLVIM